MVVTCAPSIQSTAEELLAAKQIENEASSVDCILAEHDCLLHADCVMHNWVMIQDEFGIF